MSFTICPQLVKMALMEPTVTNSNNYRRLADDFSQLDQFFSPVPLVFTDGSVVPFFWLTASELKQTVYFIGRRLGMPKNIISI